MGSSSSGSSTTTSPWAGPLGALGRDAWNIGKPILQQYGSQMLEALRTGGVNSFIPWITRALDTSRRSSSMSMEGERQNLARTGQANSVFGQEQIQEGNTRAGEAANMTPEEMIMQLISGAPGFGEALGALGVKGMGGAGNLDNTTRTTSTPSFWDQFTQGLQATAQIGGDAAMFGA